MNGRWPLRACGNEIGGSPLGGNLGRNLPGSSLPCQPVGRQAHAGASCQAKASTIRTCGASGQPARAWTLPHLTKAVHTPKLLVLLYEVNAMYRQIFLDGRPLPTDPRRHGTATRSGTGTATRSSSRPAASATTCGSTLGSPMSDAGKMTEQFRRPNFGTLEIELTIDDPKTYTKPFTVNLTQNLEARHRAGGRFCLEGERYFEPFQRWRGK